MNIRHLYAILCLMSLTTIFMSGCHSVSKVAESSLAESDQFSIDGILYIVNADRRCVSVARSHSYKGDVYIPDVVRHNGVVYRVTELAIDAFNGDPITSIRLPSTLRKIGGGAFNNCRSLTHVDVPPSVTSIYDCAFKNCESLTSIVIPQSVTLCSFRQLFAGCTSLRHVVINCNPRLTRGTSSGVWSMGSLTFKDCVSLQSVTFASSVPPALIGDFGGHLADVRSFSLDNLFDGIFRRVIHIRVPRGSAQDYSTAWGNISNYGAVVLYVEYDN